MNKCCRTCKYFYCGKCRNKLPVTIEEHLNNGISYVEEGYFAENIRENLNLKEITKIIFEELIENDFLKKKASLNKIDFDELEPYITEAVDNNLSRGIVNYFNGKLESSDIKITNADEFYCNEYE